MSASKRILVISNDSEIVSYLREELIIRGGYSVAFETSPAVALDSFKNESFDMLIMGISGSKESVVESVRSFKKIEPDVIIIAVLGHETIEYALELGRLGIYDVLTKPVNGEKLFFLIRKGMELRSLINAQHKLAASLQEQNVSLQKQNNLLAKRIEESTKNLSHLYEQLRSTYMHTIRVLAQAIDARDHYTHSHSQNVARYAVAIAEELSLSAKEIDSIRDAAELHDVGKIGIQDSILTKPAGLSQEEWEKIRLHPLIGGQILEPLTFLNTVIDMVRQHHEHYDGSGYPEGRKGEDILLGARILHIADAYESMRSARSYRKIPLSKEDAVAEIIRHSGTQFDPKVVQAFLRTVDRL